MNLAKSGAARTGATGVTEATSSSRVTLLTAVLSHSVLGIVINVNSLRRETVNMLVIGYRLNSSYYI